MGGARLPCESYGSQGFTNMKPLDFELAKANGQPLSSMDEARLRNHQMRKARKMYLDTTLLSEREPMLKNGWAGDYTKDWRYAVGWGRRFMKWQYNLGARTLNKLTGGSGNWGEGNMGYRPRRGNFHTSLFEPHGIRDETLTIFRNCCIRFPMWVYFVGAFAIGGVTYLSSWGHMHHIHSYGGLHFDAVAPCLPDDDKITARQCDLVNNRWDRGMTLLKGAKSYPLGTRWDWVEGKAVLPGDPNYNWVDGRPLSKKSRYFNPGPKEVMGKLAYEEDKFFGADGKPKPEVFPYHPHH